MDVVTVGSAIRDVFVSPEGEEVLPAANFPTGEGLCLPLGSKLKIDHLDITLGGDALNTAVTFARRGFETATIAKLGNDSTGDEVVALLEKEGIDTSLIMRDQELGTAYSVIILADDGSRTILTYGGATRNFGVDDIDWTAVNPKWFFMTHMAEKSAEVFPKVLEHANSIGAKVAVNPGKTQLSMPAEEMRPLLNLIDVFIVNQEEAALLTKIDFKKEDEIFAKLDEWVRGMVVMTKGKDGLVVSDGTTRWSAGVLDEPKVVDRTGAGDSFGSGFVSGLIESDGDVPHAMQVGSANATSVIQYIGGNAGALKKDDPIDTWGKLTITESPAK